MEQPPPAPLGSATPKLFMTPHLQKRKDGLVPSLFDSALAVSKGAKENPGGMNKPYRTSSDLLLQIREKDGVLKEDREIPMLVQSINEAIDELLGEENSEFSTCDFYPTGCEWHLELNPNLGEADQNYRLEVILFANIVHGVMNYVVDTLLVVKGEVDPNPLAPPLKGYREAKQAFELLSLKVRKSVVKFEFPDFPEGCKGRPFREVYQLNARVSIEGVISTIEARSRVFLTFVVS
jgi:hypothetical protein